MRVGLMIDGKIAVWQQLALEQACRNHEIFVLQSTGWAPKRPAKHALYYALNVFTVRNRLTRMIEVSPESLGAKDSIQFQPEFDGAWAVLPSEVIEWVRSRKIDVILKFGLGLLRVPPEDTLPIPMLSYHHGDPRKYRGRPAGFYEILDGEPFLGQIVQAIGNKLDAGMVYAYGESRVFSHSYKKTLIESFSLSPYLLRTALENVAMRRPLDFDCAGRNYRLPSNWLVVRFVAGRLRASAKRILYGLFIEKQWRVAQARLGADSDPIDAIHNADRDGWATLEVLKPYTFYADPFYAADGAVVVEALNKSSGKGEIIRVHDGVTTRVEGFEGHTSYPGTVRHDGRDFLVPETASWGDLTAYGSDGSIVPIDIEDRRIADPTFFEHEGRLYLFGNVRSEGSSVLHLWHANDLASRFERHPASPIRVSSRGSRMAGEVAVWNGQLYRLGQDWQRSYGDGVLAYRILRLSPTDYVEEFAGEARFSKVSGPHTLNRRGNEILFDYYREKFSIFAGVRRVLNKL